VITIRSGQLRHRITVEKKVRSRSSFGEETVSWSTDISVWAAVMPLSGNQYFASRQLQSGVTHRVRARYFTLSNSTLVQPGYCRIKFDGRPFTIISAINPDERSIYLDFMCAEEL
jgi:SPP1 family predicted phage head-tail adaptor